MSAAPLLQQVLDAVDPSLSATERAARGRLVAEAAVDQTDLVRVGTAVLPASAVDAIRAHKGDIEAVDRQSARHELRHVRAAVADASAALGRPVLLGDGTTGIGAGLTLIREVAVEVLGNLGAGTTRQSPVVPDVVTGDIDGLIDPDTPVDEGARLVIGDGTHGATWHVGAVVAEFSRQLWDHTDETARRLLDQALLDVADRAAERGMVTALQNAAGGTRAADGDLTGALDDAEAQAGAAGSGAAQLMIVSPVDWPAVRRAVALPWSQAPAPRVVVSSGATAGTTTILGPSAAHLFTQAYETDGSVSAPRFELGAFVLRPFFASVRNSNAVQTVTL